MTSKHDDTTLHDRFATRRSVEETLYGVVDTVNGPYAAGTGGKVFARLDDGWELVIPAGPATKRNTLLDLDVSSDRTRIWFAGSSGALGMYDVETGFKHDYSAPDERTSTWEAIAIDGPRGNEQLRIANGSGEVLTATVDKHGCPTFQGAEKPGSGSTIAGLTFGPEIDAKEHSIDHTSDDAAGDDAAGDDPAGDGPDENDPADPDEDEPDTDDPDDPDDAGEDDESTADAENGPSMSEPMADGGTDGSTNDGTDEAGTCFAIDTSGNVFAEGEDDWYRIGIENAQVNFHDIHAHDGNLLIAGGDGLLYRYDKHCRNWTPEIVGEVSLHAVTSSDGEVVVAGAGGQVYRRTPRLGWEPIDTDLGDDLHGIAIDENVAAVGASGSIIDDGTEGES